MKKRLLGMAAAGMMAIGSMAQATTFSIIDNPGGQLLPADPGVANFGIYGTPLTVGDSLSLTFQGTASQSFVGIGFDVTPANAGQFFEVVFTGTDFTDFGVTDVYLSSSASLADAYDKATITQKGQLVELSGASGVSPFYILYQFSSVSNGSFTGDLTITPVPLPATLALMLAGLGGLGVMRRRKANAA